MSKKVQKVVRTYAEGVSFATDGLKRRLDEGYHVVMCNQITDVHHANRVALEYIVEKEIEEEANV